MDEEASEHIYLEAHISTTPESPRHGEHGVTQRAGAIRRPASALPERGSERGDTEGVYMPVKSGSYVSPAR